MQVNNLALSDFLTKANAFGANWQTGFVPATVSFDVVWSGPVTRRLNFQDFANIDHFAGEYAENQVSVTWSGSNANGFAFTANPGNSSTSFAGFAELAHEQNGTFFNSDPSGSNGGGDSAFRSGPSHLGRSMVVSPPVAALLRTAVQPGMTGGTVSSTGLGVQTPLPASIKGVSPLQLDPPSARTLPGKLAGPALHHVLAHFDLGRLPAAAVDELALARLG